MRGVLALTGDNQRGTRLVNQDGVDLVHDCERVTALYKFALVDTHIVAEVVEPHFVVCAVGNVGVVGVLTLLGSQAVDNQAYFQAQKAVYLAHPLAVTRGKVVVDRDNVHAVSGQRVEVRRERGDKRLSFTGFHLGDSPLMEHDTADKLYAVGTQADDAVGGLAYRGERFREDVVERLALGQTPLELVGLGLQLRVGHGLVLVRHGLDFVRDGVDTPQFAGTVVPEQSF